MKARGAVLAAAGLLLGGLLGGCGIPTTGVVEAGEPASGVHQDVALYFVSAKDGALSTLHRRADSRVDAALVVRMLLDGLAPFEQKVLGLTTDLPPATATVRTHGGTVTVDLSTLAEKLAGPAVDQLVCTVLAVNAGADAGAVTVRVGGVPMAGSGRDDPCAVGEDPWLSGRPEAPAAGG
ncbi:GerMN domain-containing protein [Streptomyces sp. NBC_00433]